MANTTITEIEWKSVKGFEGQYILSILKYDINII